MALGTPTLATPTVGQGGTSVTTASFTPTLGALLIALGSCRGSSPPGVLTLNPSALTWTPIISGLYDNGTSPRVRGRMWAAVVSSASAMTVQVTSTSAGKVALSIVQITGAAGIPSNYAEANNGSGDPTATLPSAPAASSTVIGLYAAAGAAAMTPPSGYTELDEQVTSSDLITEVVYDAGSAATSAAWTSATNTRSIGLLVEIQESSGAGRIVRRPSRRFSHMMVR